MRGHWTDSLVVSWQDEAYAQLPHGDNVHVRRSADARRCLAEVSFADPAIEAERHQLLQQSEELFTKLADTRVAMVVAGGWNAGKSTLINAFLGGTWMPVNVNRETVTVNRLLDGESAQLRVVFHDASEHCEAYDSAQHVHKRIHELGQTCGTAIRHIDVRHPDHPFLRWCSIVDTPGLDFSAADTEVSQPAIEDADVLLWVMHIEGPRKQDIDALRQFRQRNAHGRILVVANYADLIDEHEWADVLADKRERLNALADTVFLVSAKRDLQQRGSDPGVSALRAHLTERILPDYGALLYQRPSRLASTFVLRARQFAERAHSARLRSADPLFCGGHPCWTAEELAVAIAEDWTAGLGRLRSGRIAGWLRQELKETTLADACDGIFTDPELTADDQLLFVLLRLAPERPPAWKGISLEMTQLTRLAQRAQTDETARKSVEDLYQNDALQLCANFGRPEYEPIHCAWETAVRRCEAACERITTVSASAAVTIAPLLLPDLLLLQLDAKRSAALQQAATCDEVKELSRSVPWFEELASTAEQVSDVLPLLFFLLPAAREEALWQETKRWRSSESYEAYLERYPEGRFAEQARQELPHRLRSELVRDRDNPGLRGRYLAVRTPEQRQQDELDTYLLWCLPDGQKSDLARMYGPLPVRDISLSNARKELLGE